MKFFFTLTLGLWALFTFSGCGGLLDGLRAESAAIDREAGVDQDDDYDRPTDYKPKTLRGLSANNVNAYDPPVQRGYGRRLASATNDDSFAPSGGGRGEPAVAPVPQRRYTRQDFVDSNASENSLWDSQGQENFLFTHNRQAQPGDLVTVDVDKELKREIQYQLWMTLPAEQRRKRKPASADGAKAADGSQAAAAPAAETPKSADEKNRDAAEEAAKTNLASGGKEDDVVRMEVAENLGNGIMRLVGQKRVIYRGVARIVEVTSLVNNKDVDSNGRVKSSAFLDMKTQVIQ
jgi:flagellar basal body L-ring protein FlgH